MANSSTPQLIKTDLTVPVILAGMKFTLHLAVLLWAGYGLFRDELYYIVSTGHLDFGYVDHPPLSILLLAGVVKLFGNSMIAVRLPAVILGAMTVFFVSLTARDMGGRRFAQLVAGLCAFVSLFYIAVSSVYSMNAIDLFLCSLIAWWTVRLVQDPTPTRWMTLGFLFGLGLQNKIGMLWVGAGLFAGFLLTSHRKLLKSPWPWFAGILAFLLFTPYVLWNLSHDMAHLEFIREATTGKYSGLTRLDFLLGQSPTQNPSTLPFWIGGLIWLFLARRARAYRYMGIVWVTGALVLLAKGHMKPEYLAALYTFIFPAGGLAMEGIFTEKWKKWRFVPVIVVLSGMILSPITLPVLPVNTYIAWADRMGIQPHTTETNELAELPQFYADRFGWEQKATDVARVYERLTEEERQACVIYGTNYGRASAVNYFGHEYELPPAISGHNSYWIWGPGKKNARVVIAMGGNEEGYRELFGSVELAAVSRCTYCMPYENNMPIYVLKDPKMSLQEIWPQAKHYQ
ncbi:MAG TPA: glycosyltransferase family 39 protein [Thermoanaerobaculia bacterium]|nr:glycosyltransferase family 39 protein [Thermoanaerobaculia bacterium]HUM29768.1 glycosyltransferase family 39 protein [Thermoanaerobaculia bacterium]HXK67068.1 glycosyltransferase family 39 protein [Thermoanaerobaculia bacterium]